MCLRIADSERLCPNKSLEEQVTRRRWRRLECDIACVRSAVDRPSQPHHSIHHAEIVELCERTVCAPVINLGCSREEAKALELQYGKRVAKQLAEIAGTASKDV
eukprot:3296105-Amphidinium_carterae.1